MKSFRSSLFVPIVLSALAVLVACSSPEPAPPEPAPAPPPPAGPDLRGEPVDYTVGETALRGYMAWDAAVTGPRPGVLVVHEWWGHNDYARERADMLAEMGYTAFALDMYGEGKLAEHPDDAQAFVDEVISDMPGAEARFRAALELLREHPSTDPERTAAIGYCFGGGVVLHMARVGEDLDAVASFHGSLGTAAPAQPGTVKARVLVLNGNEDPMVTPEHVEAFEKEMADAGVDMRFVGYPGAQHSFTNPGATAIGEEFGMPLAYHEEADRQSWAELEEFLAETFTTPAE